MKLSCYNLLLILLVFYNYTILAQGYTPTQYGNIQVEKFGDQLCSKPFGVAINTDGNYSMSGTFTVIFNPAEFQLTDPGDFTLLGPNTLIINVNIPTHFINNWKFKGNLVSSGNANFSVDFMGNIGPTQVFFSNSMTTPAIVNIGSGLLSNLIGPNGPLLAPGTGGVTAAPQYVRLIGNLIIDLPEYNFERGSEILVAREGLAIDVAGNSTLRLNGTEVYGCKMWDGFTVQSNGRLDLLGGATGETIISDAVNAVTLANNSYLKVFWSTLKGNQTGIKVNPNGGILQNIGMDIVRFNCYGGTLLDGSPALTGLHFTDLNTVNFPFFSAGAVALGTTVYGFQNGMLADNAKVFMQGVFFENMQETGITAKNNSTINFNGLFFGGFKNMQQGILNTHSDLTVTKTQIDQVGTGIRCEQSLGDLTSITDCRIKANMYGITVIGDGNSTGDISKNEITIPNSWGATLKGYGIGLLDMAGQSSSTNDWNIMQNKISVSARSAIYALDFENAKIRANTWIRNTANKPAILIYGGYQNEIECNPEIQSAGHGVVIEESPYFDHSCNTINSGSVALQIFGDCDESKVRGNNFTGAMHDLAYGDNNLPYASTGSQIYHRNRFLGNSSTFEAINFSSFDIADGSKYRVNTQGINTTCPTDSELMPTFQSAAPDWFSDVYAQFSCVFNCSSGCTIVPGAQVTEMSTKDQLVRDGIWGSGALPQGATWNAKRYLFRKLIAQAGSETDYSSFIQNEQNSSVGKTTAYETELRHTLNISHSDLSALQQLQQDRQNISENIAEQAVWKWENEQLVFDADAQQAVNTMTEQLQQIESALDAVQNNLREGVVSNVAILALDNAAIPASDIFEINQQTVNALHLQLLKHGIDYQPDNVELQQIANIAQQCPFTGGLAVYQARAMLEAFTGEVVDDPSACVNVIERSTKTMINSGNISIAPNPANRQIIVNSMTPVTGITVFNALGNLVYTISGSSESTGYIIDVATWADGFYFIQVNDKKGQQTIHKIVVSK